MTKLTYADGKREFEFLRSQSLFDFSNENQVVHLHVFCGLKRYSICRVQNINGLENCLKLSQKEQLVADKLDFPDDIRLAYQMPVCGNAKIRKARKNYADRQFAQEVMQTSGSIGSNK